MLKLLALDRFTLLLFVMVLLASLVPVSGQAASVFGVLTTVAIAILFFLHGAKLSREAVIQGMMHWKLHALVFAFTFILFPVLGLLAKPPQNVKDAKARSHTLKMHSQHSLQ